MFSENLRVSKYLLSDCQVLGVMRMKSSKSLPQGAGFAMGQFKQETCKWINGGNFRY